MLLKHKSDKDFNVYVGCAKWNRADLKGFYPKGTKDELTYYATQFNSIEMNATFYNMPNLLQVEKWKSKTPPHFKFFPKITNSISHYKRLIDVENAMEIFCNAICGFEEQLCMVFLQLHENFKPKDFDRLKKALFAFPKGIPLAVEVRNEEWFSNSQIFNDYTQLLKQLNMTNLLVDTPGRRDMLHMSLTTPKAFIRYVSANHKSDSQRLNDWINRIKKWRNEGLQELYFFVHQNMELESPLLASYFIKEMNKTFDLKLHVPKVQNNQGSLFGG